MRAFSGPVRPHETASHRPGCRTPTWWSWGDRLSPSPPADSKSSSWSSNAVAQRAPPSTRCCCAPTRAHPSPRRLGPRRTFPARSEGESAAPRVSLQGWICPRWSEITTFGFLSPLWTSAAWKMSALPTEAQVEAQGMGRQLDMAQISKEKTGVHVLFGETSTFNINGVLRWDEHTKRNGPRSSGVFYWSDGVQNRSQTADPLKGHRMFFGFLWLHNFSVTLWILKLHINIWFLTFGLHSARSAWNMCIISVSTAQPCLSH